MIPLRDDNPTRITPYVTWALVAINVLIFLVEQFAGGLIETREGLRGSLSGWTCVPYEVTHNWDLAINGTTIRPFWLTLFTSMFLHGGWTHLGGNMLFLVVFGNNIEEALGRARYIAFYLACGVLAAAAQIAIGPDSFVPTLGASGAIAGVLGGYLLLYPHARVNSLIFLGFFATVARVPAYLLLGFWIVSQFFSQITGSLMTRPGAEEGGVAYMAHIGGFIAGLLLIRLFGAKPTPLPNDYTNRPPYNPTRY